jgi:hypothetical protein
VSTPLALTFQYRDRWYSYAPEWLTEGNAERYMYTLQLCTDLLLEKMNQAMRIRIPGQGDVSQLPYLAFDRQLLQGPAEPDAQFTARLSAAFSSWNRAGSRISVLEQLQAYMTGLQPGVPAALPQIAIVGGCYPTVSTWDVVSGSTPSIALDGGVPAKTTALPANFNWDGQSIPWRAWLVLYESLVPTGQSGGAAIVLGAYAGSYTDPGKLLAGVWVPATSGTPVNSPFQVVSGLSGLTADNLHQWLTLGRSSEPGNDGTWPIVQIIDGISCVIANPNGLPDAGADTWSISAYPYIGPAMPWGTGAYDGSVFGQGELSLPPLDHGSNVGGVWQPTTTSTNLPVASWGLDVSATVIQTIRGLLGGPASGWKNAGTWYRDIVVAFDGVDGTAGSAYSPNSSPGSGNPDGTFGEHGKLVAGVWVPTRLITSPWDAYCQGTGRWVQCSVENVT